MSKLLDGNKIISHTEFQLYRGRPKISVKDISKSMHKKIQYMVGSTNFHDGPSP